MKFAVAALIATVAARHHHHHNTQLLETVEAYEAMNEDQLLQEPSCEVPMDTLYLSRGVLH